MRKLRNNVSIIAQSKFQKPDAILSFLQIHPKVFNKYPLTLTLHIWTTPNSKLSNIACQLQYTQ